MPPHPPSPPRHRHHQPIRWPACSHTSGTSHSRSENPHSPAGTNVCEQEAAALRAKADAYPKELEAAVAKAVKETVARFTQESAAREDALKRDHLGEKNVLTTRITALENTVQEQAQRLTSLLTQTEKAYAQVQDIAVRAVEGSAAAKQLAGLQQLLADQPRKNSGDR